MVLAMITTTTANAGLWDSVATSGWEERPNAGQYKLDVYGFDMRVYEFHPKNDPGILCVAAFSGGDTNGFEMECNPVTDTGK